MRVFVTGASGFIGSAVVQDLIKAGHHVVGLARSDEAAAAIARAAPRRTEVSSPTPTASSPARVPATASSTSRSATTSRLTQPRSKRTSARSRRWPVRWRALGKPLVIASGTLMVSHARPGTENDAPASLGIPRAASEATVLAAAGRGVRGSVVRLAPAVHDRTRAGLVSAADRARAREGLSRRTSAAARTAGRRSTVSTRRASSGWRWNARSRARDCTRWPRRGSLIEPSPRRSAKSWRVPVRSVAQEDAAAHFGWLALSLSLDNPTSSTITRDALQWHPQEAGLLADLSARA